MNSLLKTHDLFLPLRLGGDLYMTPGNSRGNFQQIQSLELGTSSPSTSNIFFSEKKTHHVFLGTNKNLEQKKTPPNGEKNHPCGFSFRLWGPEKHVPVSLAKRSQCRHSRHGSCGEQFVVCRGDDGMMIL